MLRSLNSNRDFASEPLQTSGDLGPQSVWPFHYSSSATSRCVWVSLQVSCSFDYLTRSASNLAYNYCLMGFEFVLPVSVIVFCYAGIVLSVRRQAGELRAIQSSVSNQLSARDYELNRMHREKRQQEYKLAKVLHSHQHQYHHHHHSVGYKGGATAIAQCFFDGNAMCYVLPVLYDVVSSNNGTNGPESKATRIFLSVH